MVFYREHVSYFLAFVNDENLFGSSDNSNKDIDIILGNRYGIKMTYKLLN